MGVCIQHVVLMSAISIYQVGLSRKLVYSIAACGWHEDNDRPPFMPGV